MRRASPSPIETPIGWRVVLGLAESGLNGWEKVRRAQITEISRLLPMICAANLAGAALLAAILWDAVPHWELMLWFGALAASLLSAIQLNRAEQDERAVIPPAVVRRSAAYAGVIGLLWAAPALYFSGTGTIAQQLAICLVLAGVMGMATLTTSAVPCAMMAFVAVSGAGLTAMMAKSDSALLALTAFLFVVSLAAGGAISGRAFLRRKWVEISLAEKTELVSLLLREFEENDADWLWQVDSARRLENVHPRLARAAGRGAKELEGMPLVRLLAGDAWESGLLSPPLRDLLDKMNDRESFSDLDLPVMIAGDVHWWRLSAAPRQDERGAFAGFRGVGSDVTEQRRSAERINRMARYDALTGLANRVHFLDSLHQTLARAARSHTDCALMLIDLDRFKAVNDTLGHPVGDKLLRAASQRLTSLVREGDVCSRLGGDEFAIMIASAPQVERLDDLSQAVIEAMALPFEIDGHLVHIGASVGTAVGPRDGRSVETLMRNADLALYRSKEDGRGRHRRFQPGLLARAERRRVIEAALREAIDAGQFRLAYQPIADTRDSRVCGFEALLRWRHPELGDVAPADFLPIAEEARLLGPIGRWVLREACTQATRWPSDIRLYVNLAAEQLHDADFPAAIQTCLAETGLAPNRLELEISEAMLLRDAPRAIAALERIQMLGARVALDNFGAGHCALGYVRQSRFSTIKVDRTLIAAAAERSAESIGMIRAVVAMADTLGLIVIAQGAETRAELTLARELGCRQVQGHMVGSPMRAADTSALLAAPGARKVA